MSDRSKLDDHYYAVGYDASCDPYVYENGVLINSYGIQSTSELNLIENKFTVITIKKLIDDAYFVFPVDLTYYTSIHRCIFSEIYPWAGEVRKVDICKGQTQFCHHDDIYDQLQDLFTELNTQYESLSSMSDSNLAVYIGFILGQLNNIHPFREGNGRTQRVFIHNLLHHLGYKIDWNTISPDSMANACIEFNNGNTRPLERIIHLNLSKI
ncbi:Fic family protein [Acinetobacter sp. NyZ410]|uniref:Fic/DOC family protein n=1 Tax=Acinetobacter sp. NyZ410 TaxID=2929509 RepID=UPI001FBA9050|nr:Fic family protein [Acinetobacter sp. NyZ410]UOH17284.1 Fic family protein [Acinetobacter sp. NyZ410]